MHTETLALAGSTFFNGLQLQEPEGIAPAMSAARAAAEAAFEATAAPLAAADGEPHVVVIRRKKVVETAGEPVGVEAGLPDPNGQVRRGRVFRVGTTVGTDAPEVQHASATTESERPDEVEGGENNQRKRRRRSAHGPVTVTRPVSENPAPTEVPNGSRTRNGFGSPAPVTQRSAASRGSEDPPADSMRAHLAAARRYRALVSRISRLQEKAEARRRVEAASAVQRIRQAIATYGLTARDLAP